MIWLTHREFIFGQLLCFERFVKIDFRINMCHFNTLYFYSLFVTKYDLWPNYSCIYLTYKVLYLNNFLCIFVRILLRKKQCICRRLNGSASQTTHNVFIFWRITFLFSTDLENFWFCHTTFFLLDKVLAIIKKLNCKCNWPMTTLIKLVIMVIYNWPVTSIHCVSNYYT